MSSYTLQHIECTLVKEPTISAAPVIGEAGEMVRLLREFLGDVDREHAMICLLDTKHRLIGINTVSIGSLSASLVHPREVFKPAVVASAAAIILAHNHPSGDATPSREDDQLTKQIQAAGTILGIPLLDHLILGEMPDFYSYAQNGKI